MAERWFERFKKLYKSVLSKLLEDLLDFGRGFGWTSPANSHYLPLDGMINIPIYLVWGCWVQLNSTQLNFFADHIIFNNGYMKHAHSWQRMTNNNNKNRRKQV